MIIAISLGASDFGFCSSRNFRNRSQFYEDTQFCPTKLTYLYINDHKIRIYSIYNYIGPFLKIIDAYFCQFDCVR